MSNEEMMAAMTQASKVPAGKVSAHSTRHAFESNLKCTQCNF